ncbi:hypothetical protein [Rhizobium terrae]|uniref:hypothetical protein n=1 Tax=Rhizobium terrae TaxID=2171756 RepID=UPI000E3C89C0|nr:hypothetical protein [Rhizobium terrae]
MPFPILTALSQAQCTHAAKASFIATSSKVLVDNGPVVLSGDQVPIAGCPFTVPTGKPQPCVKGVLSQPAVKVMVEGKPAMLQGPADMGQSAEQIPGGPLIYSSVQMKVTAT